RRSAPAPPRRRARRRRRCARRRPPAPPPAPSRGAVGPQLRAAPWGAASASASPCRRRGRRPRWRRSRAPPPSARPPPAAEPGGALAGSLALAGGRRRRRDRALARTLTPTRRERQDRTRQLVGVVADEVAVAEQVLDDDLHAERAQRGDDALVAADERRAK